MSNLNIDALLDDRQIRVIVCCGAGGVGKTTCSAALAVRAAARGRRVVVLTIDPARRLAQALGLDELDNDPRPVSEVPVGTGGGLWAMTLDMKRTFDEIVEAHADPDRAATILANPIYKSLSTSFAGTQEYMAMEKLAQLSGRMDAETWDLIVVDTPPSRSALDFLDAPERLGSFLDGPLIRLVAAPAKRTGRAGLRALGAGVGLVGSVLDRILGAELLGDARTFINSLDAVFGSFRDRADQTYRLLQSDGTAFLVVAAPERDAIREATYFVERLSTDDMPLAGLIVNRLSQTQAPWLSADRAAAGAERLHDEQGDDAALALGVGLLDLHHGLAQRVARETSIIDGFAAINPQVAIARVPALASDVHDVGALATIGELMSNSATAPTIPDGQ